MWYGSNRVVDTLADRLDMDDQPAPNTDSDGMIRRMAMIAIVALVVIVVIRIVAGAVM